MESGKEGVWVYVWGLLRCFVLWIRGIKRISMIEVVSVEEREGGEGLVMEGGEGLVMEGRV